jgi:photosystem II stability/assembly factor-like uncharacterized protein
MNNQSKLAVGIIAIIATGVGAVVWWRADSARAVSINDVSHIHGIAVDPNDTSRLYLATHHGVFHTSPDGTAQQVSENSNDYMGFTPHPTDAQVIYASGHPSQGGNMGVLISRDGGRSWTQLATGVDGPVDFHAMDVSRADSNMIYGVYGDVQVSRDGGITWAAVGAPPADIIDIAASAINPDFVYAATLNGLTVSRDAGSSWEPTGSQGQPASLVQTAPDGTVYAFIVGSGLMQSPGAALDWRPLNDDFGERVLLHLAVDPTNPDHIFGVTDESEILVSTDGGRSWQPLSS